MRQPQAAIRSEYILRLEPPLQLLQHCLLASHIQTLHLAPQTHNHHLLLCSAVAKPDQLHVNASAPTSVPLRVRFGTGTPTAAVPTVFPNPMNPTLVPTRSELPLSTLGGGRSTDEEDNQSAEQVMSMALSVLHIPNRL